MTTELRFEQETHRYYLKNGSGEREIPGVTSVIRSFVPGWQAGWFYLDRGKAVHSAVKLALEDKLDWSTVDPRCEGRVRAILNFIDNTKLKAVAIEKPMASQLHQFAGTVDLVGVAEDDGSGLLIADWKSSFEPSAAIQLGLYSVLWAENHYSTRQITRGVIVECGDKGEYRCNWLTKSELRNAGNIGLAMLTTFFWKQKNGLLPKDEAV